ncbi:MAG: SCO family protein [Rhodospirillaceae bacterium]
MLFLYLPRPAPPVTVIGGGEVAIGGPFTLVNGSDETVTEDVLKGRYSLIYFGFTYCPDICPLALQTITDAIELLGPAGEQVQPIFISVDPERDTPSVVDAYVDHFHPAFIGLTGSLAQTTAAANAYKVYAKKAPLTDADGAPTGDYLVDHTGFIYLMNPEGKYAHHFGGDATAEDIAAYMRERVSAP